MNAYAAFTAIAIGALSLFSACSADGDGNSRVMVTNSTDRAVRVYYEHRSETDSGSEDQTTTRTECSVDTIGAGSKKEILVSGDAISDPDLTAVYGGIVTKFTANVDIFGYGELEFDKADFYK